MIRIYRMSGDETASFSLAGFEEHFPERYKKAQRFRFDRDRNHCIGAGILLWKILGVEEKELRYNPWGKPFADGKPFFSISHSGGYVVLGVGDRELGADIECTDRNCPEIMPRVFTEEEIAFIGDSKERFYIFWTLKESIAKASGEGLSTSLNRLSLLPFLKGEAVFWKEKKWYGNYRIMENGKYILSCVSKSPEKPEYIRYGKNGQQEDSL